MVSTSQNQAVPTAIRKYVELNVEAGFIPARSSNQADLRAGIRPAFNN